MVAYKAKLHIPNLIFRFLFRKRFDIWTDNLHSKVSVHHKSKQLSYKSLGKEELVTENRKHLLKANLAWQEDKTHRASFSWDILYKELHQINLALENKSCIQHQKSYSDLMKSVSYF